MVQRHQKMLCSLHSLYNPSISLIVSILRRLKTALSEPQERALLISSSAFLVIQRDIPNQQFKGCCNLNTVVGKLERQ